MPLPSPDYVAFQGLETIFNDKDLGVALSAGYVEFYSWVDQSTEKDVYIQTRLPDNDYEFTNVGSLISLNSAGAFSSPVDGTDVQIYGYVYSGSPDDIVAREIELYHMKIYSADGILQFTRDAVPANAFAASATGDEFVDTENQVSNPQFAQVLFVTPSVTYNVTGSDTVTPIAPDWVLITSGTGTVTVTQNPISELPLDGNPPFTLGISSTGLSPSFITLRQRYQGSPRLLLNSFVNGSILVKSAIGVAVPFTMEWHALSGNVDNIFTIFDSVNSESDASYSTITRTIELASDTASGVVSPAGYSELQISFSAGTNVEISNVQLMGVEAQSSEVQFLQESYARQIDHLYHYAYPIIPIGTVIDFNGFVIPQHYLLCDGSAYSRITYSQLFYVLTTTETVSLTNTVATFTVVSSVDYHIGMAIEGTGILASTTISNIVGTTITMSAAANATTSSSVRFFAVGAGDGSTTFNVPSLKDYVIAGANGSLFGAANNAVGSKGGASTVVLLGANMPNTVGVCSTALGGNAAQTAAGTGNVFATTIGNGTFSQGSGTAVSIVQQTAFLKKCIRYE